VHTAFIYARARAEHARRIAAAALIAAAAVTPAAAWDCTSTCSPKPRPSYIGAQSDKSPSITAAQYHQRMDFAADVMANVQRGYLAGTVSYSAYVAAQRQHAATIRLLRSQYSGSNGGLSYGVGGNSSDPNNCRQRCN
jgi:hypothetical protein